jgi:putative NADPH-quinone reductase
MPVRHRRLDIATRPPPPERRTSTTMAHVLILLAHPRIDRSEANVALADAARDVDGVTLVDLYAEYPTFDIDVEREQQRLLDHDVIVFQHPVYWYSSPALLKEWQDLVLEHGFAYGAGGTTLQDKILLNAVTVGGARDVYSRDRGYRLELRDFFAPFEQTALLCRMRYLPPFVLYAAGHAVEDGRLTTHIDDYRRLLAALVEDRLDLDRAEREPTLSESLNVLVSTPGEVD